MITRKIVVTIVIIITICLPTLNPISVSSQDEILFEYDLTLQEIDLFKTGWIDYEFDVENAPHGNMIIQRQDEYLRIKILIGEDFNIDEIFTWDENSFTIYSEELGEYQLPYKTTVAFDKPGFKLEGNGSHPYYFETSRETNWEVAGKYRNVHIVNLIDPIPQYTTSTGGVITLLPSYIYDSTSKIVVQGDLLSPLFFNLFGGAFVGGSADIISTAYGLGEEVGFFERIDLSVINPGVYFFVVLLPTIVIMVIYYRNRKQTSLSDKSSYKTSKEEARARRRKIKNLGRKKSN